MCQSAPLVWMADRESDTKVLGVLQQAGTAVAAATDRGSSKVLTLRQIPPCTPTDQLNSNKSHRLYVYLCAYVIVVPALAITVVTAACSGVRLSVRRASTAGQATNSCLRWCAQWASSCRSSSASTPAGATWGTWRRCHCHSGCCR